MSCEKGVFVFFTAMVVVKMIRSLRLALKLNYLSIQNRYQGIKRKNNFASVNQHEKNNNPSPTAANTQWEELIKWLSYSPLVGQF